MIGNKKNLTIFFSLIIGLSLLSISVTALISPQEVIKDTAPFIGFYAPGFSLYDLNGISFDISDFEGKPVIIFFWASWCSVCKSIIPDLQSTYEKYSRDYIDIISINMTYQDQLPAVKAYVSENEITFPVLIDPTGDVSVSYNIRALPTAYIINPDGIIHSIIIGNGLTSAYIQSQLVLMEP
ncbi:MAG: TlpA family protein disulfide reductase [Anaerolineaceae bacterium]|nr:TlpA family protein disulfide reductase [Anaerolineaceae bacterium]